MLSHILQEIVDGPSEPGELCPDPKLLNGAFHVLMRGLARPEQTAALLMGLSVRGVRSEHLEACISAMLDHVLPFNMKQEYPMLVDTCGTGGSGRTTVNISTTAGLILAAAGIPVAKHGNWGVSSRSGSANVMEEFGYKINCSSERSVKILEETNFCFLFAPFYHPAMGHAGPIRREIKIRTIFNLAGPLSNPARPNVQLLGVTRRDLMGVMIETLKKLGRKRALVVHDRNGMDEMSLTQVTECLHLREDGHIEELYFEPRDFGVEMIEMADLVVESPAESAQKVRQILEGADGPASDQANANVAAVLWMANKAGRMDDAFEMAREVQRSGKAAELLDKVITMSQTEK